MKAIELILYCFSAILSMQIFMQSLRRSEYGVLLLSSEFIFMWLGLCVYPILYIVGLVMPGVAGESFLDRNGEPGLLTALHVFAYSVCAYIGYHAAISSRRVKKSNFSIRLERALGNPRAVFLTMIVFGIFCYSLFVGLVGLDVALINAFAARSGIMDGFGDDAKYLFLKTLAQVSLYSVCFVPWFLYKKKNLTELFALTIYFLLVLFAYLNSISRSTLLSFLIVPYLVYVRAVFSWGSSLRLLAPLVFGGVVLIYGKTFGFYMSSLLSGNEAELTKYSEDVGVFIALLQNSEFVWYSIGAGVISFLNVGPLMAQDVLYSVIGFIPSRVLEFIGLGDYNYSNADVRLPCVNAEIFGLWDCTIPPLWSGYSAFLIPVGGGMIFGFFKFYIFGRIENMWMNAKAVDYSKTCVPYFYFMIFSGFFSLIPMVIASTVFVILIVFLFVFTATKNTRHLVVNKSENY